MALREPRMRSLFLIASREFWFIFGSRTFFFYFLIVTVITSFSFTEALGLFAEAGKAGLQFPELGRSLSPFDGVMIPTFGGLYLTMTLLFPLVAIQSTSAEVESGSLRFVQQWPVGLSVVVGLKACAALVCWFISFLPIVAAMVIWRAVDGHLNLGELMSLGTGYLFYAFALIGIGFSVSAITKGFSSAALWSLGFTIGFWALDFASQGSSSNFVRFLSRMSLTQALKSFERGIFSCKEFLELILFGVVGIAICTTFLLPALRSSSRWARAVSYIGVATAILFVASSRQWSADLSEDRRNSFPPAVEAKLLSLDSLFEIRAFLSPEDSRFREFERNYLAKLHRVAPTLKFSFVEPEGANRYQAANSDRYGMIEFHYKGRATETRSLNSAEMLQTMLSVLALESSEVTTLSDSAYPGYPWAGPVPNFVQWIFVGLGSVFALIWILPKRRRQAL